MLVSISRYRDVTGDETSASAVVETALTDAQGLLEEELGRELEQGTRTERCRVFREGRGDAMYPSVTPIISVTSPAGSSIAGPAVIGNGLVSSAPTFLTDPDEFGSLTYVGGYDANAADGDADRLPRQLERAICWAAYADLHVDALNVPAGATTASVGDVSVSFPGGYSPGASGEVTFSRAVVRRYRRRRDLTA